MDSLIHRAKELLRHGPWTPALVRWKGRRVRPTSQNGEDKILADLAARYDVPQLFVEFGFGGWEFNCAGLAEAGWEGLLVDGDRYNETVARTLYGPRVDAMTMWIDLDSISQIERWIAGRPLGILSIDVDGNDYWFLERLIGTRPAIISCEYNVAIGLRPVVSTYRRDFSRWKAPHRFFGGASLGALDNLCRNHGYRLVGQVADVNAFFVREDLLGEEGLPTAESLFRGALGDHWDEVKGYDWVEV